MHRKRAPRILGILKSQLVEFCLGRRRLTFACSPRPGGRCHTSFGADRKVSRERWYLYPYVEKPFNSKVIKSFVPELRSRKYFSCFGIPMFYVYMLWTFYVHFTYSCMAMLLITWLAKVWTAIDRLSIIWKSDLTDKIKPSFYQTAVVSILLYGCTTWTLSKRMEKKLNGNFTRMLRDVLNKS